MPHEETSGFLTVAIDETGGLFFPDETVEEVRGTFVHLEHAAMQRGFVHVVGNHEELD